MPWFEKKACVLTQAFFYWEPPKKGPVRKRMPIVSTVDGKSLKKNSSEMNFKKTYLLNFLKI